jgi:Zn-dependent M28 family amino/carboxypeptidase
MKKTKYIFIILFSLTLLWGCHGKKELNPITPEEIEGHIRFLSHDLIEGRAVGSTGIALAALYQENHFRRLGLEPAFGESYRQEVNLVGCKPDPQASIDFFSDSVSIIPEIYKDFVITSERRDCPEGVEGELVYGGYLIRAPERDWDDIKGVDLKGKVLLVEINEPGNYPNGIFDGESMTYYGRWVYKFEKASELGATGILIIHNKEGATHGWDVVENSWSGESFFLHDVKNNLFFQGWINKETAKRVIKGAGYNREELKEKASQKDFKPVFLGLNVRVRQEPVFHSVKSENIAGILRGKAKKESRRYVILSAHYDHFGRDENKEGDQIYNGAVDNCSASASMLSLARYYAQRTKKLKADLVFVAVTAEEQGLLGSDYFARHLPFPSSAVLANLNFEMTNVWGRTKDVYTIGGSHSDLGEICAEAAKNLGLEYIPERNKELGYFFRSDQLSFARAGIPAVWLHEGIISVGKDKDYIQKKSREYREFKYHKVTDEFEEDWDLKGTVQITDWAREIISILSGMENIPQFKDSSSFKRK